MLFAGVGAAQAGLVKLENSKGSVIEVELVELQGEKLSLKREGRIFSITLDQLSKASQDLVRESLAPQPSSAPSAEPKEHGKSVWGEFFPDGLTDAKGAPVPFETLEGKMVCLYFGASWCGICKAVVPSLKTLRETVGEHVEVVMIGRDSSEKEHLEYMKKEGLPWPALKWSDALAKEDNPARSLSGKYQAWGLPTIILLSKTGELIDEEARFKIQWLPEDSVKRLEGYDYREAVQSFRESAKSRGEKVTPEQEAQFLDAVRSDNEEKLAIAKRLKDLSKSNEKMSLGDTPSWEQILTVFYQAERKRR
jgi:thiol-disulfide isomerase/thioredoxin